MCNDVARTCVLLRNRNDGNSNNWLGGRKHSIAAGSRRYIADVQHTIRIHRNQHTIGVLFTVERRAGVMGKECGI